MATIKDLSKAIAAARKETAEAIKVAIAGASYSLSAASVLLSREGLIALEAAKGRFEAVEPEYSDHCHAPTKDEIKEDPTLAMDNPYTNSKHEGYEAVRALLKASDPAVGMAESYIAANEKNDPIKLAGDPNWTFALNIKKDWARREGQAVGYLYNAFKARVGMVKQTTEPATTTSLVRDFSEVMRKRSEGKSKGVPEAEVKQARFWFNLIDWAMNNRAAAEEATYRHSLGLKTPAPDHKERKPSEVTELNAEQLAQINTAIQAGLDKAKAQAEPAHV